MMRDTSRMSSTRCVSAAALRSTISTARCDFSSGTAPDREPRVPQNRVQRRAQFVGQGREELVLQAIGDLHRLVRLGVVDGQRGTVRDLLDGVQIVVGELAPRHRRRTRQRADRASARHERHAQERHNPSRIVDLGNQQRAAGPHDGRNADRLVRVVETLERAIDRQVRRIAAGDGKTLERSLTADDDIHGAPVREARHGEARDRRKCCFVVERTGEQRAGFAHERRALDGPFAFGDVAIRFEHQLTFADPHQLETPFDGDLSTSLRLMAEFAGPLAGTPQRRDHVGDRRRFFRFQQLVADASDRFRPGIAAQLLAPLVPFGDAAVELPREDWLERQREQLAALLEFGLELPSFRRAFHRGLRSARDAAVLVRRLDDVVCGPQAHGGRSHLFGAGLGEHDDRHMRIFFVDLCHHLQAVAP
jgi:hypothetical protein